jgi:uncharacterized integral membrane protein
MRVAGLRECLEASQASAVRRGHLNLDRRSTRALTRGVPTIGGMAHAIEHLSNGKASKGPFEALELQGLTLPQRGSLRPPPMPRPTEQPGRDNDQINAVGTNKKWSIWRAANAGLLVAVLPLALQIANGRGVELASYAQTATAETVLHLAGQILAAPLLFVIIALIRNIFQWRLPNSDRRAIEGAILFVFLLVGIGGSLAIYGHWFFSSTERISGGTRDYVMSKMQPACLQRQMSLKQGANPSDDQISKYCTCVGTQIADNTTYKRLASDSTAPDVQKYLKQQAEAAGQACQVWAR